MKSEYGGDQLQRQQASKNASRTLLSNSTVDSNTVMMTVQSEQQTNKCLSRNPGAGGLFDEALIRHVNLAAAFHDHISCTKLPSEISKAGGFLGLNGSMDGGVSFFGSTYSSSEDKEQINMLREMVLVQLDLIQQQNEQLLKKERQLLGLKHDREALCVRLEKTEKRVAILTKKLITVNEHVAAANRRGTEEESISKQPSLASNSQTDNSSSIDSTTTFSNYFADNSLFGKKDGDLIGLANNATLCEQSSKSNTTTVVKIEVQERTDGTVTATKKRVKRSEKIKSPLKRSRPSKSADSENSNSNLLIMTNSNSNSMSSISTSNAAKGSKEGRKTLNKRRRTTISSGKSIVEEEEELPVSPVNLQLLTSSTIPKEIFVTDNPYEIVTVRENATATMITANDLDCDTNVDVLPTVGTCLEDVEVPKFRVLTFSTNYSLEGTENIDDDVFVKRHSKLEIDERRRKRWDLQRLREQKHMDKLKQGRYYSGSAFIGPEKQSIAKKKLPEIDSFYPEPHEAHFIEVCDKLPVVAFGHPIPRLTPKQFTLPWTVNVTKPVSSAKPRTSSAKK